jgi:hypothetical protein
MTDAIQASADTNETADTNQTADTDDRREASR